MNEALTILGVGVVLGYWLGVYVSARRALKTNQRVSTCDCGPCEDRRMHVGVGSAPTGKETK